MAKAVLVMDMPKNCYDCRLYHVTDENEDFCGVDFNIDIGSDKPDWCPLISQTDDETAWYDQGYIDGWNDCLIYKEKTVKER